MKVRTILIEERCDRCKALLCAEKYPDEYPGQDVKAGRAEKRGKPLARKEHVARGGSVVVKVNDKDVLYYENVCSLCMSKVKKLVGIMGVVDRTQGGKLKANRKRGK